MTTKESIVTAIQTIIEMESEEKQRVKRLEEENKKLKHDLEHLRRKVAHGCTDFSCKECDQD